MENLPQFGVYMEVYDYVNRKKIIDFSNLSSFPYKSSEIQKEMRNQLKELFEQKPAKNEIIDFYTSYSDYKWSFFSNNANQIIFLYYAKSTKKSDVKSFFEQVNDQCMKSKEGSKDAKEIQMNMKTNLQSYFKFINETDTTFKKIDRANQLAMEGQKKIAKTLQDVTKTKYNVDNINQMGKEAYDVAD